jgi:capsular polysaccharide biosynthesis protein
MDELADRWIYQILSVQENSQRYNSYHQIVRSTPVHDKTEQE